MSLNDLRYGPAGPDSEALRQSLSKGPPDLTAALISVLGRIDVLERQVSSLIAERATLKPVVEVDSDALRDFRAQPVYLLKLGEFTFRAMRSREIETLGELEALIERPTYERHAFYIEIGERNVAQLVAALADARAAHVARASRSGVNRG